MAAERRIARIYHLVDERNWTSIQKRGLLSTNRLAAAEGIDPAALKRHRTNSLMLPSGIRIRDQRPMPPNILARALTDGATPEDWYDLLNSMVFFWVDPERLNRQRKACGAAPQIALVIDAVAMLAEHRDRAAVTPINTGNAMRAAAPRSRSSFVPYRQWVAEAWSSEAQNGRGMRPATHRPVELTIRDAVPDIMNYVLETIPLGSSDRLSRTFGGNSTAL
jgi:hypothetical protein